MKPNLKARNERAKLESFFYDHKTSSEFTSTKNKPRAFEKDDDSASCQTHEILSKILISSFPIGG